MLKMKLIYIHYPVIIKADSFFNYQNCREKYFSQTINALNRNKRAENPEHYRNTSDFSRVSYFY